MLRGLYSAATALVVAGEQQEVTAHNLAHTSTPGYKSIGTISETFDRVLGRTMQETGDLTGVHTAGVYHDFRPGALQQTGNPYDLAIAEPDLFFVVNGPNGPLYTRNGAMHVNARGEIVTTAGYRLQGEEGPIEIPTTASRFHIANDGSITADGAPTGRIKLVKIEKLDTLTAAGPTLYTATPESGVSDAQGRVIQGTRESSNVQPADAMVRLIIGARYFDAAQRSLRAIAESIQLNTKPQ